MITVCSMKQSAKSLDAIKTIIDVPNYHPLTFSERPDDGFIKSFLAHVAETSSPETFPGLYYERVDKSADLELLAPISIPRRKRLDGDVPCPICWHKSQFLNGYLVWLPSIGVAAVIGDRCAANMEQAKRDYSTTGYAKLAALELVDLLPLTSVWKSKIKRLETAYDAARKLQSDFNTVGAPIKRLLRGAVKTDQRLDVIEEVDGQLISQNIGYLKGSEMVSGTLLKRPDILRKMSLDIIRLECAPDEVSVTKRIAELSDSNQLVQAYETLRNMKRQYVEQVEPLIKARQFFAPMNLKTISDWLNAQYNSVSFKPATTATRTTLKINGQEISFTNAPWDFEPQLSDQA